MTDPAVTTTAPPPTLTPGPRTSEFWLKILAIVAAALIQSNLLPSTSEAAKIVATISIMLGALGYGAMRTSLKRATLRTWASSVTAGAISDNAAAQVAVMGRETSTGVTR